MTFKLHCHVLGLAAVAGLILPVAPSDELLVPEEYPDLKSALHAAVDGDTILLADGVYTGPRNRKLDFRGKAVVLRGAGGAATCVVDCEGRDRAFCFQRGETKDAVLEGITIRNGIARNGGAILIQDGSEPTLRDCIFEENVATGTDFADGGGAIRCESSSPTLERCQFLSNVASGTGSQGGGALSLLDGSAAVLTGCVFFANRAQFGGAMVCDGSAPTLVDCTFDSNAADLLRDSGEGGAVFNVNGSAPTFEGCSFLRNVSQGGAGAMVAVFASCPRLTNCRFLANRAALSCGAVLMEDHSDAILLDCCFVANSVGPSGGGDDGGGGEGGALVAAVDSNPVLVHCSFVANFAPGAGAICSFDNATPLLVNCVLWGNSAPKGSQMGLLEMNGSRPTFATIRFSAVEQGEAGVFVAPTSNLTWDAGNMDADPGFARAPDPGLDGQWGTFDDDYGDLRLIDGSPAIDAGDNDSVPPDLRDLDGDGDTSEPLPLDAAGRPRFVDDPATPDTGIGAPPIVDLGAFEFQPRAPRAPAFR